MKKKKKKAQVNSKSQGQPFFPVFPDHPTGQEIEKFYSHDQRVALVEGKCPYCDTDDIEGFLFGGSDDREGGLLDCPHCKVAIAWIDNPFEATEKRYED